MSLAIQTDTVRRVLLADGWHDVYIKDGIAAFTLDAYEFMEGDTPLHRGGQSGISSTGFRFVDRQTRAIVCGPLSSILAVDAFERSE